MKGSQHPGNDHAVNWAGKASIGAVSGRAGRGGRTFAVRLRRLAFSVALAASTVVALPSWADQVVLTPARDATLFEDNVNFASGAGAFLFIGNIASGSPRRALVQFDLSGIPAGATIISASLQIFVDRNGIGSSQTDLATLHRLTADWGEGSANGGSGGGGTQASPGDATWAYRFFGDPGSGVPRLPWSAPGGDFVAARSGEALLASTGRITFASTAGLVGDVQSWLDDPTTNFGWIILGNEARDQAARRFRSRESAALVDRPSLTVVYQPIPEPSAYVLLLAGLGFIGLLARRRYP